MIPEYGKIQHVGHRELRQLFDGPVVVQEKIDGSQFSATVDENSILHVRSKGCAIEIVEGEKYGQFSLSIAHIRSMQASMVPGWVYRFEAMAKPRHNVLAYDRAPAGNLVLYDVSFLEAGPSYLDLNEIASAIRVEPVQTIFTGVCSEAQLPDFLAAKPQLGGAMMEGVVIKNYAHGLKGKFVAPRFQEIMHGRPPRAPKESPVIDLGRKYCSEARWEKAISHLRDAGVVGETCEMKDVGPVIKEVQRDILEECGEEIRQELFDAFSKDLRGGWIQGLPDWYKRRCGAGS